jgi:hypothetical protein
MIRPRTLEEYGEKQVIVLEGHHTLGEAVQRLRESEFSEGAAYLVVALPENQFRVALFSEFKKILVDVGPAALSVSLANLPIREAGRVDHLNTKESGKSIVDWAVFHNSTAIAINDNGFVGLFANITRSAGIVDSLSLLELSGDPADLAANPLYNAPHNVQERVCPYCGHQGFYVFGQGASQYTCRKCGKEVKGVG